MNLPNFKYFYNNKAKTLDVVLHGGSQGIDSPFILKLISACRDKGNSVLALNFPYLDRGEKNSSGPDLKEELSALKDVMVFCKADSFNNVRFVAKSLGAIVASFFLRELPKENQLKYSIVVLGYVVRSIDLKCFKGKISIIQGEKDKFGGIEIVKNDMESAVSGRVSFFQIEGADHSYRKPETKEPIYEDRVIDIFSSLAN